MNFRASEPPNQPAEFHSIDLDAQSRQMVSFLFEQNQFVAKLKRADTHASLSLWDVPQKRVLVYVTSASIEEQDIAKLLNACFDLAAKREWLSSYRREGFEVHLFAPRFDSGFITKLPFLLIKVHCYEWQSARAGDKKETTLIRELVVPAIAGRQEGNVLKPGVLESNSVKPLSADELSALVQLGMELRQKREAIVAS